LLISSEFSFLVGFRLNSNIGCKFALGTDAHDLSQLDFYQFALLMARRGWAEKKDILNCWSLPKIEKALKK